MADVGQTTGARAVLGALLGERVVVCDGAMGTMLHAAGVPLDRPPGELNVSRPDLVQDLHVAYILAGARIVQTNTFGANRLRLAGAAPGLSVTEINIAGARLARVAARQAPVPVLVAGSVGPATGSARPSAAAHVRESALREQMAALADWVDLLVLETFGDIESLATAVELAGQESDLPVIAQLTFGTDRRTLRGETATEAAEALSRLDVVALGANCTVGPAVLQDVVVELVAATALPVSVQPNAGVPQRDGRQVRYARNASYFGRAAALFAASGAAIVGGCCGTTPAHISAMARAVDSAPPPTPRRPASPARPAHSTQRDPAHRAPAHLRARPPLEPAHEPRPAPAWLHLGGFVVVAGLRVPRGDEVGAFVGHAEQLLEAGADALAVAAPPPPSARVSPVGVAIVLRERLGVEVILPAEAADRSLAALQADLLGAHALGLRTVLCRTGSPFVPGDYPDPGDPWEVDSVGLIGALHGLNQGVDWRGVATAERTQFVIGGTVHTWASDLDRELDRAQAKVRAGAHFLVTNGIYDLERAVRVLGGLPDLGIEVPVLASLAPFDDVRTVEALGHETPEVAISQSTIDGLRSSITRPGRTIELAVEAVEKLRGVAAGVIVAVPSVPEDKAVELIGLLDRARNP